VSGLDLEHQSGVGGILGGGAPVDVAAGLAVAQIGQLAHQRNERMTGEIHPSVQRAEIDQLSARFGGDLGRGVRRHQADRRLGARQGGLEVEPALKLLAVAEDLAQLLGAEQILEVAGVDNVCVHGFKLPHNWLIIASKGAPG